jgi:hypothetical protein
MAKKTTCPISRAEFPTQAKAVMITLGGAPPVAEVKGFSTGSPGGYLNGQTGIDINGTPVSVQLGLHRTTAGSKERPSDEAEPVESAVAGAALTTANDPAAPVGERRSGPAVAARAGIVHPCALARRSVGRMRIKAPCAVLLAAAAGILLVVLVALRC